MRILLVVAARKDSGAGAVAVLTCRALRAAGADARLLCMAGRDLETRLAGAEWAHAGLRRERSPRQAFANLAAIRGAAARADVVICHLPHDHLLCLAAGVRRTVPLVRAFRHPRHLRPDPYRRALARRADGVLLANHSMAAALERLAPAAPALVVPVPLDDRFHPCDGTSWRHRLGVAGATPVVGAVGKIDRGRGFDTLLAVTAALPPEVHAIAVGGGPLQPALAARAATLGLADRLHWLGYHDRELPALYATMDVVLFLAPGSDWGHRMISEAQGCGRPVVAVDVAGVRDLIDPDRSGLVVPAATSAVAAAVHAVLTAPHRGARLADGARGAAASRRLRAAGVLLLEWLGTVAARRSVDAP